MADSDWMHTVCNGNWWSDHSWSMSNNDSWSSIGNSQDTSDSELKLFFTIISEPLNYVHIKFSFELILCSILTNLNILIGFLKKKFFTSQKSKIVLYTGGCAMKLMICSTHDSPFIWNSNRLSTTSRRTSCDWRGKI